MESVITGLVSRFGYWGVLLLIAVENIFPPIPSEVILTFGGFLTTCTEMTPPGIILFSTLGSVAGAIVLYGVGRLSAPPRPAAVRARPPAPGNGWPPEGGDERPPCHSASAAGCPASGAVCAGGDSAGWSAGAGVSASSAAGGV